MEEGKLKERLEELIIKVKDIKKNHNWGSPMRGAHGVYLMYNLMFKDKFGSDQWIIVKSYLDKRENGKYSVITDKSHDCDSVEGVISNIIMFYGNKV